MVEEMIKSAGSKGKVKIAYVHAAAIEEAYKIKALVEEKMDVLESIIVELPPSLGVHSGPGTAGICFFPVNEQDDL